MPRAQSGNLIRAIAQAEKKARVEVEAQDRVAQRANAKAARDAILTLLRDERKRAKTVTKYKAFHKDIGSQGASGKPSLTNPADTPIEFAGKVSPVLGKDGRVNAGATAARQRAADIRAYRAAQQRKAEQLLAEENAAQKRIVEQDANKRLEQINGALVALDKPQTAKDAPKRTPLGRLAPAVAFDGLVRLGDRTSKKISAQPTIGGIGTLLWILVLLEIFLVKVDSTGQYTRAQLLWMTFTGDVDIPLVGKETATEAAMMAGGQAAEQFILSTAAATGSALVKGASQAATTGAETLLGDIFGILHIP